MSRSISTSIKPFLAMSVQEKALEMEQAGHHIIKLTIGQPDFVTPDCVLEAAQKAIRDGQTGYTHSLGIWPLREAIARYYHTEYGVTVSPERVVISGGSSPGMLILFDMLLENGDEVITGNPSYACYNGFIRNAGGVQKCLSVKEEDSFQLKPDAVRAAITPKTRAVMLNSPSNPAGTIMPRKDMQAIAQLCRQDDDANGIMLVSDEIYHGLSYEGHVASALELTDNCCVVDGFSKRYAMTGWRLGWMVLPQRLIPTINALHQNFFICACSISQWAGLAALKCAGPDVERMRNEYDKRRKIIIDLLRDAGFGVKSSPAGAFYILADARAFSNDSLAFSFELLEHAKVAVAPGIDFGSEGEGFMRFSYANSIENIEEAMHRIKKYLSNR